MPNQHKGYASLTDKDKSYIRVVHSDNSLPWESRMRILTNRFDVNERNIRRWIKKLGFSTYKEIESEHLRAAKLKQYNSKYIILTWAQNDTPVHKPFWDNLLAYAKHLGAEVGVIPGRYVNPTSLHSRRSDSDYWDDEVVGYLDNARHEIHPNLVVVSDLKISPTAANPLNGLQGLTGSKSMIIGHPRVHSYPLPVLEGHHKKNMMTTGACTLRNYTDSKAGQIAAFHHVFGAVIVEIKDKDIFYNRQITATDDGSFTDLIYRVKDKKVSKISEAPAVILGDIHVDCLEEDVMDEAVRYFKKVTPKKIVLHDLINGTPVNHHEADDPIIQYQKFKDGSNLIKNEIRGMKEFIDKYKLTTYDTYVVRSNHEMFYERYILETNWKKDIPNALEYMEYAHALLKGDAANGILPYIINKEYGNKIKCLNLDDSLTVMDFELAQHGHLGANGSHGGIEQNRKLNTKIVTGHVHYPYRKDGAIGVGTFTKLRLPFMHGPSNHNWAFSVIHDDGKNQLLIFGADRKFTTLY